MKRAIVPFVCVVLVALVGCNASEGEMVDTVEEIVGTWSRRGGLGRLICRHSDDGTLTCAQTVKEIESGDGFFEARYWFEDGKYHEQSDVVGCSATGVYEIVILESGNLQFELIEDECSNRKNGWIGIVEEQIEWGPMP